MKPVTYDLRCKSANCRKIAYFNFLSEKDIQKAKKLGDENDIKILGVFCSTHKEIGMVDVKTPRYYK
jgi:hypothetical protein